jgi:hypothetical protein
MQKSWQLIIFDNKSNQFNISILLEPAMSVYFFSKVRKIPVISIFCVGYFKLSKVLYVTLLTQHT